MIQSRIDDKRAHALSEHYHRQYDLSRRAHGCDSSSGIARRRNRARRKRCAKYFLLILCAFAAVESLVVLAGFWS